MNYILVRAYCEEHPDCYIDFAQMFAMTMTVIFVWMFVRALRKRLAR